LYQSTQIRVPSTPLCIDRYAFRLRTEFAALSASRKLHDCGTQLCISGLDAQLAMSGVAPLKGLPVRNQMAGQPANLVVGRDIGAVEGPRSQPDRRFVATDVRGDSTSCLLGQIPAAAIGFRCDVWRVRASAPRTVVGPRIKSTPGSARVFPVQHWPVVTLDSAGIKSSGESELAAFWDSPAGPDTGFAFRVKLSPEAL
jgi:hypothetical protein